MDLSLLNTVKRADEGVAMQLRHPLTRALLVHEGDGRPVTITLAGQDAKRVRHAQRELITQRAKDLKRRYFPDGDADERDVIEVIAKATLAWDIIVDGAKPECTFEEARNLYRAYPWIVEQADAFIFDRANFLPTESAA